MKNAVFLAVAVAATSLCQSVQAEQKWYEGGTLHKKTVSQWSQADSRDKLATAADFVTQMWKAGVLKDFIASGIKTMDDVKPLAQRLSDEIDLYFSQGKLAGGTDVTNAAATVMHRRWTKQ